MYTHTQENKIIILYYKKQNIILEDKNENNDYIKIISCNNYLYRYILERNNNSCERYNEFEYDYEICKQNIDRLLYELKEKNNISYTFKIYNFNEQITNNNEFLSFLKYIQFIDNNSFINYKNFIWNNYTSNSSITNNIEEIINKIKNYIREIHIFYNKFINDNIEKNEKNEKNEKEEKINKKKDEPDINPISTLKLSIPCLPNINELNSKINMTILKPSFEKKVEEEFFIHPFTFQNTYDENMYKVESSDITNFTIFFNTITNKITLLHGEIFTNIEYIKLLCSLLDIEILDNIKIPREFKDSFEEYALNDDYECLENVKEMINEFEQTHLIGSKITNTIFENIFNLSECIKYILKDNFICNDDIKKLMKFTNIFDCIKEICIYKYNLTIKEEETKQIKQILPIILKSMNLKKKRASDGIYWYGLEYKNGNKREFKFEF